MLPILDGIDHVHVFVKNREEAAAWYEKKLGFKINKDLEFWAQSQYGPLNIEDPTGKIHLALINSDNFVPSTVIAFKSSGTAFLQWKQYLEKENMLIRCQDYDICWSLYFKDLDGNSHEITTFQHDYVSAELKPARQD